MSSLANKIILNSVSKVLHRMQKVSCIHWSSLWLPPEVVAKYSRIRECFMPLYIRWGTLESDATNINVGNKHKIMQTWRVVNLSFNAYASKQKKMEHFLSSCTFVHFRVGTSLLKLINNSSSLSKGILPMTVFGYLILISIDFYNYISWKTLASILWHS